MMRTQVLCLSIVILQLIMATHGRIVISEIMYAPRVYEDQFEFVEIYNTGQDTVTLTGWRIPLIGFTFPASTIAPGEYKLVVGNTAQFRRAYTYLRNSDIIGEFAKASDAEDCKSCMSDKGAQLQLLDAQGAVVSRVEYDNKKGWSQLASGFGSSLELICYNDNVDINNAAYWAASSVPQSRDPHREMGGTPGRPPQWRSCYGKVQKFPRRVQFSEIMYHPVGQKTRVEQHEFIELVNSGDSDIDISSWRIVSDSGVRFTFRAGTSIRSGQLIVVAKDTAELRAVYGNIQATVFGNYSGELKNGECKVALIDNNGFVRDYIKYDDKDPWPRAADALGASAKFLPPTNPYKASGDAVKYKGQSLTRRTLRWDTDKPETWYARSPTPGTTNYDTEPLLPIIGKVKTTPKKAEIKADSVVTVEFELHPWPIEGLQATTIEVLNFREDVASDNPSIGTRRNTTAVYDPATKVFKAELTTRPANTVVRYKVIATFGGKSVTSPSPKDPYQYHSIFYSPSSSSPSSPTFHLWIKPANWAQLKVWAEAGRWDGCNERATWENKAPCTLVHSSEGTVTPCFVRYQGSQYNRRQAVDIVGFPGAPPGGLKAYSYRISLPNFGKVEGTKDIILHKMWQGCPMYETPIFNRVMEEAGIMGTPTSFARLNINGNFLRYMMVLWPGSSSWLNRWNEKLNRRCSHQSYEGLDSIGELYKVGGSHTDVADTGPGDWRVFAPFCGHSEMKRYQAVYSLSTNKDFGNHNSLSAHIHYLNEQVLPGRIDLAARRKWLSDNFDVNLILNYIVVIGWAGTWDQIFHNQVLYRRETDRKWSFHPWDADGLYSTRPADSDLYAGDTSQPHLLRRAIIRNFKEELNQRYRLFQATIHSKDKMTKHSAWANTRFDRKQANEGFGKFAQNLDNCVNSINNFVNARWDNVNGKLGAFQGNAAAELARVTCPSKPSVVIQYMNYTSLPGAPIDFQVIRRSATSAELRWFPPNNFGKTIVAYIVRSGPVGEPLRNHPTRATIPVTEPMAQHFGPQGFLDDNLATGSYRYTVAAVYDGATAANFAPIVTVNLADENNNNNNNNNGNNNGAAAIIGNEYNYGETPAVQTQYKLTSGATVAIMACAVVFIVIVVVAIVVVVPKIHASRQEESV